MRALRVPLLVLGCTVLTVAFRHGGVAAAAQAAPQLASLLEQASAYVAAYEPRLGSLISHEDYVQSIDQPGATRRRLSADLVLVRLDEKEPWLAFRNVIAVDGAPVADRDDRLVRIFADPTAQSLRENAQRIVNESARFNFGGQGNTNVPPFALTFLRPANIGRFRFSGPRAASIDGVAVWRVDYQESARPTIIKDQDRVSDAPADGTFWLRASDAGVVRSLVHTGDKTYSSEVRVDYCMTSGIDILVPCTMSEKYSAGRRHTVGEARYSDIRRFDVTTSTEIK